MLAAASLAVAVLCGQTHAEVAASLRVEARARSADVADAQGAPLAADLEVTPALVGALSGSGVTTRLSYAPTIRWREPYSSTTRRSDTSHRQSFSLEYNREGSPHPYLLEGFSYGLTDLTTLFSQGRTPGSGGTPSPAPLPAGAVPLTGITQEIYVDALLGVRWPLATRLSLDTNVGYTWGGGADAASRVTVPVQHSARAAASLGWQPSRYDALTTVLLGQFSLFDTLDPMTNVADPTQLGLVQLSERWDRQLGAMTRSTLTLGAAVTGTRSQNKPELVKLVAPLAQVSLTHRLGWDQQTLDLTPAIGASPFVDRYLATVYERLDGSVALNYRYRERLMVSARGGLATAVGNTPQAGLLTSFVDGSLSYTAARYWQVALNGAGSWAQAPAGINNAALYQGFQWVVGLSFTVRNQGTF